MHVVEHDVRVPPREAPMANENAAGEGARRALAERAGAADTSR